MLTGTCFIYLIVLDNFPYWALKVDIVMNPFYYIITSMCTSYKMPELCIYDAMDVPMSVAASVE
jgi:hypothetical protein